MHARTHTHTDARARSPIRALTRGHTYAHKHAHVHARTRARTHTYRQNIKRYLLEGEVTTCQGDKIDLSSMRHYRGLTFYFDGDAAPRTHYGRALDSGFSSRLDFVLGLVLNFYIGFNCQFSSSSREQL
ncbi:hypothetical protein EVAR_79281_1 [Eumeta japonica]|uniref:Uncharacterized protein n=1 Tax=Eumeta variegata TaxID=151549 RepID=A0A4C1TFL4_EUMVA|nr:hypothetical protein EVAR_79281_1 [Eumeta japonica]